MTTSQSISAPILATQNSHPGANRARLTALWLSAALSLLIWVPAQSADTHAPNPGADTHAPNPGADTHSLNPGADTHSLNPGADTHSLKLATWNLEWLMTAAEFDHLAPDCVPELVRAEGRAIPCNIAQPNNASKRRSPDDLDRLRAYARALDADVVALQEVDGPDAARLVFPDYEFCFTRRVHVQNVGFAVRRGIAFRCGDYAALGLPESSVRWGADLTLFPGTAQQIRLLAVHLKSGCHQQVLTNRREECQILADQVPALKRWIQARAREGVAFAVVGDFNRRFSAERPYARDSGGRLISVWPELTQRGPPDVELLNTTAGQPYIGCSGMDRFHAYIDHIVLGGPLTARMVPDSFERTTYTDEDARNFKLSDHCPVAVRVELTP